MVIAIMYLLKRTLCWCLLVFIFVSSTHQVSLPNSTTDVYTAAVVGYYPVHNYNLTAEERVWSNLLKYWELLDSVQTELDIVVFPESTLTTPAWIYSLNDIVDHSTQVPNAREQIIPCDDDSEKFADFFKNVSCTARKYNTYLVLNLWEKENCTINKPVEDIRPCAPNSWSVYNTNVAFDRNGTVVARYRKFNLFREHGINTTYFSDLTTFATDFGVTFGMFICFDLLFHSPTNVLVENGVKHFIFSTMWVSELPFFTALQAQFQWAYEHDVTFLTAGANNPSFGCGGTAIWQGKRGAVVSNILSTPTSNIYVADVVKDFQQEIPELTTDNLDVEEISREMDDFHLKVDDLQSYKSSLLANTSGETKEAICSDFNNTRLCCDFSIAITFDYSNNTLQNETYRYRLVVYNGIRSFPGVYNIGVEVCGVVACLNESLGTCGLRFKSYDNIFWRTTFEQITISGNFSTESGVQHPNSLLSHLHPLNEDSFEWTKTENAEDSTTERRLNLVKTQNRLLTFAIYGRNFKRDGPTIRNGSNKVYVNRFFVLVATLLAIKAML